MSLCVLISASHFSTSSKTRHSCSTGCACSMPHLFSCSSSCWFTRATGSTSSRLCFLCSPTICLCSSCSKIRSLLDVSTRALLRLLPRRLLVLRRRLRLRRTRLVGLLEALHRVGSMLRIRDDRDSGGEQHMMTCVLVEYRTSLWSVGSPGQGAWPTGVNVMWCMFETCFF